MKIFHHDHLTKYVHHTWFFPSLLTLYFLVLNALLTACGTPDTTQSEKQSTPLEPSARLTFASDTPVPDGTLDLASVFRDVTPLPIPLTPGAIVTKPQNLRQENTLPPTQFAAQHFEVNGQDAGYVAIYVYATSADGEQAYTLLNRHVQAPQALGGASPSTLTNIGDHGLFTPNSDEYPEANVIFRRCHAVVDLVVTPAQNPDVAIDAQNVLAYAQKLDQQLAPIVCSK